MARVANRQQGAATGPYCCGPAISDSLQSSPICYNWIKVFLRVCQINEEQSMSISTSLIRGLLLRCPNCGRGKLFRKGFTMYEKCPVCGWRFEREEGYWTGAIAINLVVTELLIALVIVPLAVALAAAHQPLTLLLLGLPLPILLPFLF